PSPCPVPALSPRLRPHSCLWSFPVPAGCSPAPSAGASVQLLIAVGHCDEEGCENGLGMNV
ncbi:MAG: hypothetical protein Q4F47_09015, partial [Bacteroidaceae bacterium]|nr:hypothetical protein [Bacteroidaceae bacterium]